MCAACLCASAVCADCALPNTCAAARGIADEQSRRRLVRAECTRCQRHTLSATQATRGRRGQTSIHPNTHIPNLPQQADYLKKAAYGGDAEWVASIVKGGTPVDPRKPNHTVR